MPPSQGDGGQVTRAAGKGGSVGEQPGAHLNPPCAPGFCTCFPFPPPLPAQAQRWQQQDHEDEEGVTLVHSRPVLSRPEGKEEAVNLSLSPHQPQEQCPHHFLIRKHFPVSNLNSTQSTTGT